MNIVTIGIITLYVLELSSALYVGNLTDLTGFVKEPSTQISHKRRIHIQHFIRSTQYLTPKRLIFITNNTQSGKNGLPVILNKSIKNINISRGGLIFSKPSTDVISFFKIENNTARANESVNNPKKNETKTSIAI